MSMRDVIRYTVAIMMVGSLGGCGGGGGGGSGSSSGTATVDAPFTGVLMPPASSTTFLTTLMSAATGAWQLPTSGSQKFQWTYTFDGVPGSFTETFPVLVSKDAGIIFDHLRVKHPESVGVAVGTNGYLYQKSGATLESWAPFLPLTPIVGTTYRGTNSFGTGTDVFDVTIQASSVTSPNGYTGCIQHQEVHRLTYTTGNRQKTYTVYTKPGIGVVHWHLYDVTNEGGTFILDKTVVIIPSPSGG